MLRESRYNYEFTSKDGRVQICNGLSGTIVGKPPVSLASEEFSQEDREFLLSHHFIVEDGLDETELVHRRNASMADQHRRLELTIMLHENCNFRCTYCFEDFINRKLTGSVLEDLVTFVSQNLPEGGVVANHFYGGEPLLAWDSLVHINDTITKIVDEKRGTYQFFITSNGSLLTPDKASYLSHRGVAHVKITLDGPPSVHDLRRPQFNGTGTFHTILRNLSYALPMMKIILRVNVDPTNIGRVPELLDILDQSLPSRQNLYLDFNMVLDPHTGDLVPGLTYQDLYEVQSDALDRGYLLNLAPLTRYRYCKFNSEDSYLVDTSGSLYLCSKSPQTAIGSLRQQSKPRSNQLPMLNPGVLSAFHELKDGCAQCEYLPICGGGCTLLTLTTGKPPCPPWKGHVDQYLQIYDRNDLGMYEGEEA